MRKPMKLFAVILVLVTVGCGKGARDVPQHTIEQFVNTTTIFGSSFSHDETRIAFSSDRSGVFNAYVISTGGGEATQLTHSDGNSVIAISFFPEDDRLLCRSDEGGNEIWHLYLREEDGSMRDLTPWEGARSTFHDWSHDGKSFFFNCNKRDSKFMDVYEIDIVSFTPKMIYSNDEAYDLHAVSNNGRYLAFQKTITTHNSDMYLYDRENETETHISPHNSDINYTPMTFSADSRRIYYLTDEYREFSFLRLLDIGNGYSTTVEEADWDIVFSELSRTDKYLVVGINANASTEVRIYNTVNGDTITLPELPDADITAINISKSEELMTFYVNGSRSPNNLYLYDFATKQYSKLTTSLNPEINADGLVDAEVVTYKSFDDLEIPAILYKPHQVGPRHKAPALVWVHGGPGGQSRTGYRATIQYLVNHGYVVLAVNNRGSSGYGKTFYGLDDLRHGEDDLGDCVEAKKFLVATGYVDPDKIGILGGSYGGYMVLAALAFRPDEFTVGVDLFGISNWVRTLESIPPWWEAFRESLYKELGDPKEDKERLHRISPLFHAENIRKPLMVLQGGNDPRVLKVESDEIVAAVKKNGVPVEYVLFDDEGHGFRKKENRIRGYKAILDFLDQYLRAPQAAVAQGG